MPIKPEQYRWRPDDHFSRWNICDDCLLPLGDAIQYRVEVWHRPPAEEEDDSRPDYPDILERRFYAAFDRPLDKDLQRFDIERALFWLRIFSPSAAADLQEWLDKLRQLLDPRNYTREPDEMIVQLANFAWYLRRLAVELRPLAGKAEPARGGTPVAATSKAKNARPTGNAKKLSTDELMILKIRENPEAAGWSIRKWEVALGRSKSTIQACDTWRKLRAAHALGKVEKLEEQERKRNLDSRVSKRQRRSRHIDP